MRHAFAAYLPEGGADLKSVSTMAGHSRSDIATGIYQHEIIALMRAGIEKWPAVEHAASMESDVKSVSGTRNRMPRSRR